MTTTVSKSELESLLIDLVREQPILYNKTASNYRNRLSRENVFREIATKLGMEPAECQNLWQTVRAQYMGFRRKLVKPSGSGKKARPFFRHEEAMKFIGDLCEDEGTFSNVEAEDQETEQQDNDQEGDEPVPAEGAGGDNVLENIETPKNAVVPRSSRRNDYRSHEKFGGKRKLDAFDEDLLALLKTDDEDDSFGRVVAVKLKSLRTADKKVAADVEFKIHGLLHEAAMNLE